MSNEHPWTTWSELYQERNRRIQKIMDRHGEGPHILDLPEFKEMQTWYELEMNFIYPLEEENE